MAKSSIPFGRIKRHPKAWPSAEVEGAVSERRKAFAAAHRSDEDRQAYISASRRASSVIVKAKAEAWQTTCSTLSPKSNPKTIYSLCSIAGSPSSSPNQDSADLPGELLRPLTRSYLLLLLLGRLFLLALSFLLGICLASTWSSPFPLHAAAPIPFFLAKVRLSTTLTFSSLMIWYSGLTALFLFLLVKATPAYMPTALFVALRPLFPF